MFKTVWPSGLRRWLQAPVRKGVGSNPTAVIAYKKGLRMSFQIAVFMWSCGRGGRSACRTTVRPANFLELFALSKFPSPSLQIGALAIAQFRFSIHTETLSAEQSAHEWWQRFIIGPRRSLHWETCSCRAALLRVEGLESNFGKSKPTLGKLAANFQKLKLRLNFQT